MLLSPIDFNEYFNEKELNEIKLEHFSLGEVSLPTGKVLVRSPLCYLDKEELPYLQDIPQGEFPVTVCAAITNE